MEPLCSILSQSVFDIEYFSNTKISGKIDCQKSGVLYTSIPQNGNWIAYVDGKQTDTIEIGNAMVGLHLTEGQHEITFRYRNTSFYIGATISAICLIIFSLLTFFIYRDKNRKIIGKYE